MSLRVISYGGGVQSTALVVLAAQGVIDFPVALFSNVGDDSEHPATLAYIRDVATPWAAERGIEISEVLRRFADGRPYRTLYQALTDEGTKGTPIPAFLPSGAPARRGCTSSWKVDPVLRELRRRGATADDPATVAIGISVDEMERASNKPDPKGEVRVYPLLELGLTRQDCIRVIEEAELPVPPKSSCYFCPYHSRQTWSEMRRDHPELFERAAALEDRIVSRNLANEGTPMYLTRTRIPLRQAVSEAQTPLWAEGPDTCDEGYCWT